MLLKYYGVDVPLDQLEQECNVRVTGCTAADVIRVGKAHGVGLSAYQMDADALMRMDRPAIIWWSWQHFVVFCGLNDAGEPVLSNPSCGRYPVGAEVFARRFSGIAIVSGHPADLPPKDYFGEESQEDHYFDK